MQNSKSVRLVKPDGCNSYIASMASTNDILAIGWNKNLQLFDVRSWEMLHASKFDLDPNSLHLTADLQYLTISNWNGGAEKCIVLKIV